MSAEEYLQQIPMWTKKKNSLKEVRAYLAELGNPDRALNTVHVAGTNGKGSVCAFLTSILRQAGLHTGTFVSPHLENVRERFLIDGQMAGEEDFEASFERVRAAAEAMVLKGFCHPTFFEFVFYMSMVLFAEKKVDMAVVETGLGGRLDATNVLEHPKACVITSIGLDHTQYLGNTIAQIAAEKAGIIKAGVPLVFDARDNEAEAVLEGRAFCQKAARFPVDAGDFVIGEERPEGGGFYVRARLEGKKEERLYVPFDAPYQAVNAVLAAKTALVLRGQGFPIGMEQIREGIRQAKWPGRMERVLPGVYIDGAHNPQGIQAFKEAVRAAALKEGKEIFLLFGAVSDKDHDSMAEELCRDMDWKEVGIAPIGNERGEDAGRLAGEFRGRLSCPVTEFPDAAEAARQMAGRAKGGLLFCAGSLYLTGELRRAFRAMKDGAPEEKE